MNGSILPAPLVAALMPLLILIMVSTSIEAVAVAGVFWLRQLSGTDTLYGLVLSCWAIGSIIGAYLAGTKRLGPRTLFLIVGGGLCMALAILTEGLVPIAVAIGAAFVLPLPSAQHSSLAVWGTALITSGSGT